MLSAIIITFKEVLAEMKNAITKDRHDRLETSRIAFWMISAFHDNPLLPFFRNPYRLLQAAGLKPGQTVLEVGCVPGFFTIPSARIVGEKGMVYAVDINPLAIRRITGKIQKQAISNVKPLLANAADTTLPGESVDIAFLFGLPRIAGGRENLIAEMHRVLRPGATLVLEKRRTAEEMLTRDMEQKGFAYKEKCGGILKFARSYSKTTPTT